jgi:hypothetical protein
MGFVDAGASSSAQVRRLPAFMVTDTFDDPLPAADVAAWEGDS